MSWASDIEMDKRVGGSATSSGDTPHSSGIFRPEITFRQRLSLRVHKHSFSDEICLYMLI
jgi:hypothetical protein